MYYGIYQEEIGRTPDLPAKGGPATVGLSSIVLSELEYGVEKSQKVAQSRMALTQFVAPLEIVEYDSRAAYFYGRLRSALEREGQPIGPLDQLIAAHALALDCTLVTNNKRAFVRVEGLRVADSSIFPRITNGNLNGPSIMVGEKMSDHILGRDPLPKSNDEPWMHPEWEREQR